jgi:hypothetical protein
MNFIHSSNIDVDLCDALIAYHKQADKIIGTASNVVDLSVKNSMDCELIKDTTVGRMYMLELQTVVDEYIDKYKYANEYSAWAVIEPINVQHYQPEGGYYAWHTERSGADFNQGGTRHLAFMTYLNDVNDGGETEFFYQKLKVKPEKGLTLMWPADWTHTHRGITSPTQDKYIVTGWFNYYNNVLGN